MLLEERKKERKKEILTFQNNKEIHNGCAKMQKYIVAGSIKGFLIICKLKTKKLDLSKLPLLQDHTEKKKKMQEWGFLGVIFVCK